VVVAAAGLWRIWSLTDAGRPVRGGRSLWAVALAVVVVATHAWAGWSLYSFYRAGQQITEPIVVAPGASPSPDPNASPATPATPGADPTPTATARPSVLPGERDRVTILIVGADNTHNAVRALTDTLMVASFDPVAQDLVMISIPRDTARMPLYSGGEYGPRINTLLQAAARDPERFPDGPMPTLVNEVSYLVGVPIDYYAQVDIAGFRQVIDAVGGVDVVVERVVDDPGYQFSPTEVGFHLDPGPVHLDGKYATAFVRSRHGSSDYDRARRQQQVLLALRSKLNDPAILVNLPGIVDAVSQIVRTDAPLDRLPELVSIVQRTNDAATRRFVLAPPEYADRITRPDGTQSFATQLDLDAVAQLSIELFGDLSRYATEP
jgi:LCP family protein required for cell wall assembly